MCDSPQNGKSTLRRCSQLASRGTLVAGHGSRITRHSLLATYHCSNQSLAIHNRKPSQIIENNHQRPKSIASFCRGFCNHSAKTKGPHPAARAIAATKSKDGAPPRRASRSRNAGLPPSPFSLRALPQKLIATQLLNTDVNDRKQTTATHVNRYNFRGIWGATKPKTPQRGFTSRQSPNQTHATETQTTPAGAQQNIPNHVRRDKDETRVPLPAPARLSSRATRRSILPLSNRQSPELEHGLTCRKHSTTLRSNREKMQGSHQSHVKIAVRLLLLDTPSGTVCTGFDQGCKDRARKPFLAVIQ